MKPSPILQVLKFRHMRLTTKDVKKGYYKGNRTGAMGEHTKHGGYRIHYNKVRTYVVPEGLNKFKLTPFVSQLVKPVRPMYKTKTDRDPDGPRNAARFLQNWKDTNGFD